MSKVGVLLIQTYFFFLTFSLPSQSASLLKLPSNFIEIRIARMTPARIAKRSLVLLWSYIFFFRFSIHSCVTTKQRESNTATKLAGLF